MPFKVRAKPALGKARQTSTLQNFLIAWPRALRTSKICEFGCCCCARPNLRRLRGTRRQPTDGSLPEKKRDKIFPLSSSWQLEPTTNSGSNVTLVTAVVLCCRMCDREKRCRLLLLLLAREGGLHSREIFRTGRFFPLSQRALGPDIFPHAVIKVGEAAKGIAARALSWLKKVLPVTVELSLYIILPCSSGPFRQIKTTRPTRCSPVRPLCY